jgi:Tol biopolymer transport system component
MPDGPIGTLQSHDRAHLLLEQFRDPCLALALAALLVACSGERRESDGSRSRDAQQSDAAPVEASAIDAGAASDEAAAEEEPWRTEMAREVGLPADPISIHELMGRVAFASTRRGPHTVFTLELREGADAQRLGYGFEPVWSPDGTAIAFTGSYLETGDEIAVMNADGSGVRQLTSADGQDRGPTWSPDGRSIAFWSERDDDEREIYLVNVDDGSARRLTVDSFGDMWPSWSPRGDEIVYETYRGDGAELFAVPPSGGTPRRVTPKGLDARDPAWSPDGSQIAFVSSTENGWSLAVITPEGNDVRKLAEAKGIRNPAWSPDGQFIIFACTTATSPNEDICIVDIAGRRMMNLTNDGGGFDWEPSWTR